MAAWSAEQCEFEKFSDITCNGAVITLQDCKAAEAVLQSHLDVLKLDPWTNYVTEADLILSRTRWQAGTSFSTSSTICATHRQALGFGWRSKSKRCQHPSHGQCKSRPDRSIGVVMHREIFEIHQTAPAIGSGWYSNQV